MNDIGLILFGDYAWLDFMYPSLVQYATIFGWKLWLEHDISIDRLHVLVLSGLCLSNFSCINKLRLSFALYIFTLLIMLIDLIYNNWL
jgi:hypothetical protein